MSNWVIAAVAPIKAVVAPIITTHPAASGAKSNTAWVRTIRYTPAVTMVAAWMSADTGVGPAMASGNQTNNGNWADLPTTPKIIKKAMPLTRPTLPNAPRLIVVNDASVNWLTKPDKPSLPKNDKVPKCDTIAIIASNNPASPTRLATKALAAASLGTIPGATFLRSNQ